MPRSRAASSTVFVVALFALTASARGSWAEIGLHTYDTVEFELGIANASKTLCEMPQVATLLLAGDAAEADDPESCEEGLKRVLDDHFDDPICRQGGLYISSLAACLDAIAGAMHDHLCSSQNPNLLAPRFGDVISEHCSSADICRHPDALTPGL